MGKLKAYVRRFFACLMICFTITSTAASDLIAIQQYQVYASGVAEVTALMYLLEAIMASMGISFSSNADLRNAANGLKTSMANYPNYRYKGQDIFANILAFAQCDYGHFFGITFETYEWLQGYCYNLVSEQLSSASDVSSPLVPDSETLTIDSINFSQYDSASLLKKFCLNKPIHAVLSDGSIYCDISANEELATAKLVVTQLRQLSDSAELIVYFVPSQYEYPIIRVDSDTSVKYYPYALSGMIGSKYARKCDSYYTVMLDASRYYSYAVCRTVFNYSLSGEYFSCSTSYADWDNGITKSTYGSSGASYDNSLSIIPLADSTSNDIFHVYFNKDYSVPVYSSYDDYAMTSLSALARPASRVYGLSSTARSFESNQEARTISIPMQDLAITSSVEQAVSAALAANPSITDAELNAAAADVIAAQNGTTDAVNQNTATLSTLLTSILEQVRSISNNVSRIATDGSSALDLSNVQEQFEVIEGGASDPGEDPGEEEDNTPKIWVPPGFVTVSFLAPLFKYFGEPLSELTKFQNSILENLEGAKEWVLEIPAMITDVLSPLLENINSCIEELPIREIYECVVALPGNIADALADGLSIEVPDIGISDFPQPIDYSAPLNRIVEILEQFFVIDTVAIGESVQGFENIWEEKLPFLSRLFDLFRTFYFEPDYQYPVIKIKTPDIIREFYVDEYIILCDFEDYKVYCIWARNIIKAWLWFCFGLSLFDHFKTNISIG